MKVLRALVSVWMFCLVAVLLFTSILLAAPATNNLRVAYESISAQRAPLWIALDEKIFDKHGLQVELLYIRNSTQAIPALLSGSTQVTSGSAAGTMHAVAQGAKLKIVGSFGPTPYQLFSDPKIRELAQLKGSIIGVNRLGSSDHHAVRRALAKLGISEKDVKIIPAGPTMDRFVALQSGAIQATLGSETTFRRSNVKANRLVDITKLGVEDHGSALIVTENFTRLQHELLVRFAKACVEAIALGKSKPDIAKRIYAKYLRTTDGSTIDQAYESYMLGTIARVPIFPELVLRELISDLAPQTPKLGELDVSVILDNSVMQNLSDTGFVDTLYTRK